MNNEMTKEEYHEQVRPTEDWFIAQRRAEAFNLIRASRKKKVVQPWMLKAMAQHQMTRG